MADQKITQLTEDTAPTADDLAVLVNDPLGTPASRKATLANLIGKPDITVSGTWTFSTAAPTLTPLTANRLMATDASKAPVSVTDLTAWIAGTANQITVTDDGDGSVTLSAPQNLHTSATPQFASLGLGSAALSNVQLNVAGTRSSANNAFGVYMGALTLTPTTAFDAYFQYVGGTVSVGAGDTVTKAVGLIGEVIAKSGTGTITNTYGLYIKKSSSATNNYGAYIDGNVGFGAAAPGSIVEFNLATEDLEIVDAGSVAATQQDWIEVQVGGVTGYLHVFAAK